MVDLDSTQPIPFERQGGGPEFKPAAGKYFSWLCSGLTDVGSVRKVNEDSILLCPEKRIWAVADGMGGHDAGDLASQTTVAFLRDVAFVPRMSDYADNVEDALLAANSRLFQLGVDRTIVAGSTVVVLVAHERHCLVMWAGDSRLYRWRQGNFEQITRDHSHVEDLVELGHITAAEAEFHPQANVITRAVGAAPHLFLEMELLDVRDGDSFLLCSDGLYKELSSAEIAEVMASFPPSPASRRLIDLVLEKGARDNVSVIIVRAREND